MLSLVFKLHRFDFEHKKFYVFFDSVGLVSFSISGSMIALTAGFNLAGIILLSFTTAVGGGIMRDVLINRVPMILSVGFYGTVSLLIGATFFLLESIQYLNNYTITSIFVLGIMLRLAAYKYNWRLPVINNRD